MLKITRHNFKVTADLHHIVAHKWDDFIKYWFAFRGLSLPASLLLGVGRVHISLPGSPWLCFCSYPIPFLLGVGCIGFLLTWRTDVPRRPARVWKLTKILSSPYPLLKTTSCWPNLSKCTFIIDGTRDTKNGLQHWQTFCVAFAGLRFVH